MEDGVHRQLTTPILLFIAPATLPSEIELVLGVPQQGAPIEATSSNVPADPVPIITKNAAALRRFGGILVRIRIASQSHIQMATLAQLRCLRRADEQGRHGEDEDSGKGEDLHGGG